jgi:hypothetical protein
MGKSGDTLLPQMKLLVLAMAIGLAFPQQPTRPQNGNPSKGNAVRPATTVPAGKPAPAPSNASPSITPIGPDASARSNTNRPDSAPLENKLTWFAGILSAVALLQFITLIWQAVALRRMFSSTSTHAHEMEYQSRVLDQQLKVLGEQLTALKDTAAGASSTAAAAKATAELLVSKERARLRVELQPFYLNFDAPSPARFEIQHLGSTDAFVLDSRASVYVSDSRNPDRTFQNGKPIPLPSVIGAQNPVVVAEDVLHPFSEAEIENIRELKSFVHFTGFVRYKDVFDGEHETRFNRVWSIARMGNLNGDPFTYWEHCGEVDENKET